MQDHNHSHDHDHPQDHSHGPVGPPNQDQGQAMLAAVAVEMMSKKMAFNQLEYVRNLPPDQQTPTLHDILVRLHTEVAEAQANYTILQSRFAQLANVNAPIFPEDQIRGVCERWWDASEDHAGIERMMREIKKCFGIEPDPDPDQAALDFTETTAEDG